MGKKIITDNPRTLDFKKELLMYDVEVIEEDFGANEIIMFVGLSLGLLLLLSYFRKKTYRSKQKGK